MALSKPEMKMRDVIVANEREGSRDLVRSLVCVVVGINLDLIHISDLYRAESFLISEPSFLSTESGMFDRSLPPHLCVCRCCGFQQIRETWCRSWTRSCSKPPGAGRPSRSCKRTTSSVSTCTTALCPRNRSGIDIYSVYVSLPSTAFMKKNTHVH